MASLVRRGKTYYAKYWLGKKQRWVNLKTRSRPLALEMLHEIEASAHGARKEKERMRIVRLRINNFRCIRAAEIFPCDHNVLLGPNNSGKTAVLEGLNLLLNPESAYWPDLIDENDFYLRQYQVPFQEGSSPSGTWQEETDEENYETAEDLGSSPQVSDHKAVRIGIEAVIADLTQEEVVLPELVFAPSLDKTEYQFR